MDEYTDQPMGADELQELGAKWIERIRNDERRNEEWIKQAEASEKAYLSRESGTEGKIYDFNILHSNIETMVPAVYNSAPVPDIRERFRTGGDTPENAVSRVVAQIIERAITVQIDDGAMDTELEDLVQDALLAGRGVIRIRFEADEQTVDQVDPMTGEAIGQSVEITNERLAYEAVSWRDYREGPANKWRDMPWVAFRQAIPWEEVDKIRDPELKEALAAGAEPDAMEYEADTDSIIWEIWCRETGKVYMVVEASGEILSITDDPLGLPGFFPCARPVQPIGSTGSRMPVAPFTIYRKLAEELERITKRIMAIVDGLKVRGLIAGDAASLAALADAGDNTLVPIANLEGLAQTGGLDKAITWWPVDQAVQVLRELYAARESTKQMIYEVTGISDIVRGQGVASETATAQQIKEQYGSLRIRKLQRLIERCVRELFVISAELIASKFSPQTLVQMTGIQMDEQAAAMLSAPLNHYKIDVETDSTVRADLSRRKGEMGEFLQGTAQFFATMAPVVGQAPEMAGPVSEMYGAFARQFNLGKQAEDAIEDMSQIAKQAGQQAQQQEGQPSPEEQAMQMEMQAKQAEMQMKMQEAQMKMQEGQARLQLEGAKVQQDGLAKEADHMLSQEKLALDRDKLRIEREKLALEAQRLQFDFAQKTGEVADQVAQRIAPDSQQVIGAVGTSSEAVIAEIQRGQTELQQTLESLIQSIAAANQQIVDAMTAPKELVRDDKGRPVGVKTVLGTQQMVN